MGEFFEGWRRKAGLVTLAVALLLTVAWARSYVIQDWVSVSAGDTLHHIESFRGGLGWLRDVWDGAGHMPFQWRNAPIEEFENAPWSFEYEWEWKCAGFSMGAGRFSDYDTLPPVTEVLVIPYWSLVLPLTLLSAWLILIKPRKAKGSL